MKVSVSLPGEDVAFLDEYVRSRGLGSRSSALHEAVRALRDAGLAPAYEAAWLEWEQAGDERIWDSAASDGINT